VPGGNDNILAADRNTGSARGMPRGSGRPGGDAAREAP